MQKNLKTIVLGLACVSGASATALAQDSAPPPPGAIIVPLVKPGTSPTGAEPSAVIVGAPPEVSGSAPTSLLGDTRPETHVHSLLFTQGEIDELRKAIDVYEKRKAGQQVGDEGADFLKQLESATISKSATPAKLEFYSYPQFYLESLAYHSPEDWSVWINNRKISYGAPEKTELRVVAVDQDKAVFEWKPTHQDLEKISQNWSLIQKDSPRINNSTGTVTFSLRTNQTFSAYGMHVLEGKMSPVIENAQSSPSGSPVATPDSPPPAKDALASPNVNQPIQPTENKHP